jgi:hypothetical protein
MNKCLTHNVEHTPGGICAICRNEKTLKAVIEYTDYDGPGGCEDLETGIYDLVADLLHLAHDNGIDTDRILEMGQMHFTEERREEEPDEDKITEDTENVFIVQPQPGAVI